MTVRRLKTYTAQTGYVYEYYFVGKQRCAGRRPACSRDGIHLRHQLRPQDHCAVSVFLAPQVLEASPPAMGAR